MRISHIEALKMNRYIKEGEKAFYKSKGKQYITERVDDQTSWYDRKSQRAQCWFKLLRGIEILSAAAIPLIAGFAKEPFPVTLVLGILGALIAVISSLISLNQFQLKRILVKIL